MGLFDKKNCDICGEKIGLLGNRKLDSWLTEKKTRMLFAASVLPVSFLQTDIMCLSTITKECLP